MLPKEDFRRGVPSAGRYCSLQVLLLESHEHGGVGHYHRHVPEDWCLSTPGVGHYPLEAKIAVLAGVRYSRQVAVRGRHHGRVGHSLYRTGRRQVIVAGIFYSTLEGSRVAEAIGEIQDTIGASLGTGR